MDTIVSPANEEAVQAWDGPLFDRFVQYREVLVGGLKHFGDEALRVAPPREGERALDIGCGFGDTTQQIGELVGPEGFALGVDAAPRFIAAAEAEAREANAVNVHFEVADVQTRSFGERFDYAFSRMGVMFFASPVAALRNVRAAMADGGRLVMVVWRSKAENEWVSRAEAIVQRFVSRPDTYDEPTCGPGPFSMGNADTTSGILLAAGFRDVTLRRCDLPFLMGRSAEEAVAVAMAIGPAGEILRLQGDRAAHLHDDVREALIEGVQDWRTPDGIVAPASTWIVTATT